MTGIALVGAGAFGEKHLDGLKNIDGVEIVSVISRRADQAAEVAAKYGARHSDTELSEALALDDVDAVILCTPTQMHAEQAIACMRSEEHTSELQSLMRISYAVFCLKKKQTNTNTHHIISTLYQISECILNTNIFTQYTRKHMQRHTTCIGHHDTSA